MESGDGRVSNTGQSTRVYSVTIKCEPVKEEPEWGEREGAAAAAEGLYAGHEIKEEVVCEPELLHMQDFTLSIPGARNSTEEDPLELESAGGAGAAPERASARPGERPRFNTSHQQQLQLKDLHHNLNTCGTCLMTFDSESSLRNHSCTNSVEESNLRKTDQTAKINLKCDICGKKYMYEKSLIKHLAAHNVQLGGEKLSPYSSDDAKPAHTVEKPRSHTCEVCSKEFSQKNHLISHITKLHENDMDSLTEGYICEVCKKRFRHLSQLTTHMRVHTGETPFTCDVCKKQFRDSSHLERHSRIHTGEKPFTCSICNKQFSQSAHLTGHMYVHTGEKFYSCHICEKKFARKISLTDHIRIHTGEKPFSCSVCEKQFTLKIHLTGHMRTHTGEKPFACDVCKKQFRDSSHLARHRRVHTGEKPYSCSVCNKQFSQKTHLTDHMRIHTGEKFYSCDVCKMKFARKRHLTTHMRILKGEKPFHCGYINK